MHDHFAAMFRFRVATGAIEAFPLSGWRSFAREEFSAFATASPAFFSAYIQAIAYENTELGYEAEDRCVALTRQRFAEVFAQAQGESQNEGSTSLPNGEVSDGVA